MPFKTAPSVPNITSPLPHCMLLSGLSVFDSCFPSASCGHVSPSSVPPLHVCVVCPELLGGARGFWRTDHIYTCKSSAHLLPIMSWSNSWRCCSFTVVVSVQLPLQNSWKTFTRSTHLTSFMKTCLPTTYLIWDPWDCLFSLPWLLSSKWYKNVKWSYSDKNSSH